MWIWHILLLFRHTFTDKNRHYCLASTTEGSICVVDIDKRRIFGFTPALTINRSRLTALCVVDGREANSGACGSAEGADASRLTVAIGTEEGRVACYRLMLSVDPLTVASKVTLLGEVKANKAWHDRSNRDWSMKITSLGSLGHEIFVGAYNNKIAALDMHNLSTRMIRDCHTESIKDLQFPNQTNEWYMTRQEHMVRIWDSRTLREMKRFLRYGCTCCSIAISPNDAVIYTGWNDCKLQILGFHFVPEDLVNTKLEKLFQKVDGLDHQVTAIAAAPDGHHLVTGGKDGCLRHRWVIDSNRTLGRRPNGLRSLSETNTGMGKISLVRVREDSKECIALGENGSIFLWNLETYEPRQVLFPNHGFQGVSYGGPRSHMVALTKDCCIVQLNADSETITRCRQVASDGKMGVLEVSKDWNVALCGSRSGNLQMHDFRRIHEITFGVGHAAPIKMIRVCPKMEYIISVGNDEFLIMWEHPPSMSDQP